AGLQVHDQLEEVPLRVVEDARVGAHLAAAVVPQAAAGRGHLQAAAAALAAAAPPADAVGVLRVLHHARLAGQAEGVVVALAETEVVAVALAVDGAVLDGPAAGIAHPAGHRLAV